MVKAGAVAGAFEGAIKGGQLGFYNTLSLPMKLLAPFVGPSLWEMALTNVVPNILANFDKAGFTSWVQENIPQWQVREVLDAITGNEIVTLATQYGLADDLYYMLGFEQDEDGVYHARVDAWQKYFGYNWMYDFFFGYGTETAIRDCYFNYNGENYVLWAWKGDYLNLGAGGELGFYKQFGDSNHYVVAGCLPMMMTLKDEEGQEIATYASEEEQWWITSFDPFSLDPDVEKLSVEFKVDLSDNPDMYDAIKEHLKPKLRKTTKMQKNIETGNMMIQIIC